MATPRHCVQLVIFLCLLTLPACEKSRPSASDAAAYFTKMNPDTVVAKVVLDKDEVVARTFLVTYVREGEAPSESYVTYIEKASGWEPAIHAK